MFGDFVDSGIGKMLIPESMTLDIRNLKSAAGIMFTHSMILKQVLYLPWDFFSFKTYVDWIIKSILSLGNPGLQEGAE